MYLKDINRSIIYNLNSDFNYLKCWLLLIILLLTLIPLFFISYYEYNSYVLYIDNDNYKLVVDEEFFPARDNNLYINSHRYDYEIIDIVDSYIVDNTKYYEIFINIKLDEEIKKNINIIQVRIRKDKISLIQKIIRELKG